MWANDTPGHHDTFGLIPPLMNADFAAFMHRFGQVGSARVRAEQEEMRDWCRRCERMAVAAAFVLSFGTAWGQCDGVRYRYRVFDQIQVEYGVIYGANVGASGAMEELDMDVYRPAEDDVSDRPVVILAHGGFFLAGSNDGTDVVPLCEDLARMGYVAASISYRLGVDDFFDLSTSLQEAVFRGVHDAKAAVRFFRRSHTEEGNPWGIDPDRIVLGGSSAGGFIALHTAYVDNLGEVPDGIDLNQPGLGGGIEGLSGNPGYSSAVLSVMNISGALGSATWLEAGDAPVVSTHGTADTTVPFGTGMVQLLGFDVIEVDGSWPVHLQASAEGVVNSLTVFEGAGHVPHMDDPWYYDWNLSALMSFTSQQVCPSYPPVANNYDVDAPPVGCPGDVTVDGWVTVADLLVMLAEFGCQQDCVVDANADGAVTVSDILMILGLFGTHCF
ncbi:MAG: hypothetical protein RLZZ314_175 [Bacteroidota bacterium]